MKKSRDAIDERPRTLLRDILAALVEEYGAKAVTNILAEISPRQRRPERAALPPRKPLTAAALVERENISEPQRARLIALAERYDAKSFLPRVADIRHFASTRGVELDLSQRAGAFRRILPILTTMSDDELSVVERSTSHTGPARLAPLSDAIRASGEAARLEAEGAAPFKAPNEHDERPETKSTGPDPDMHDSHATTA